MYRKHMKFKKYKKGFTVTLGVLNFITRGPYFEIEIETYKIHKIEKVS